MSPISASRTCSRPSALAAAWSYVTDTSRPAITIVRATSAPARQRGRSAVRPEVRAAAAWAYAGSRVSARTASSNDAPSERGAPPRGDAVTASSWRGRHRPLGPHDAGDLDDVEETGQQVQRRAPDGHRPRER